MYACMYVCSMCVCTCMRIDTYFLDLSKTRVLRLKTRPRHSVQDSRQDQDRIQDTRQDQDFKK